MFVKNLNGEPYEWEISPKRNKRICSKGHTATRKLIRKIYPTIKFYEEVQFSPDGVKLLYFDFYIPVLRTAIEVQGKQHLEHTRHFHKSKVEYLKAQHRDRLKQQFCELNNITLIKLIYGEESQWEQQLRNY